MHEADPKNQRLRADAEAYYKGIGDVACPYLREKVLFNAAGWEHLIAKRGRFRTSKDFLIRRRLLPYAVLVLKRTGTLQEFTLRMQFVDERSSHSWRKVARPAKYFVFTAIIDDWRLNVVVRQLGDGPLHFFSVYPAWSKKVSDSEN